MSARLLLPAVLLVAAATAGVGVLAREAYQRPVVPPGGQVAAPGSGQSGSVPRSAQPGSGAVQLSVDAAQHPDGQRVREVLQQFFDAINDHDYEQWAKTVTAHRVGQTPRSRWLSDYESSRDGSILVHRIESVSESRLRVLMTFTSTQDVVKAPAELQADCIHWRVVYPLQVDRGTLRVDLGTEGSTSQFTAC
ncbi:hypothetical protein IOD16_04600 [Saccharothrix sp. 6-C]|uniref:hypothetical protein n=1 Tax=Saccharothrix sp. 6-C TaxID=2781735 RepID=UPI0019178826|nr:hypothetical protein [Saccharothrix sp. 6-C]QQQ77785.1 hypothetical protein IOD16_04600 [Saccharothrix sp. 6-C]